MIEPTEMNNDLEEKLLSMRNLIELALLAFHNDRHELIPTAIENAHWLSQALIDNYCVVK